MKALMLEEIIDDISTLLPKVKHLISLMKSSRNPMVFTGAGISTSAGVPDYRSSYKTLLKTGPGVWESEENRQKFDRIPIIKPAIETCPTKTHMALKTLLDAGFISHIITQNVDNLHLKSGINDENLIELHGNICKEYCEKCRTIFYRDFYVKPPKISDPLEVYTSRNCHYCQGKLRKTLVNFGEKVPEEKIMKSYELIKKSDLCLCFGTSFRVNPAGKIPKMFTKENGKKLGIVNLQKTFFEENADAVIHGFCDDVFEVIMRELGLTIDEFHIKKTVVVEFVKEKDGVRMKVQGKIPGNVQKDYYNLQEIEVLDLTNKEFFKRKAEEDIMEVTFKKNLKDVRICVKFFGNSLEPNAELTVNLNEKVWAGDTLKLGYDLKLDDFLKEWSINQYNIH